MRLRNVFIFCLLLIGTVVEASTAYSTGPFAISSIDVDDVSSCSATDGTITLTVDASNQGVSPYDISLDNGVTWIVNNQVPNGSGEISVLSQAWGTYTLAVRDAAGDVIYPGYAQVLGCTMQLGSFSDPTFSVAAVTGATSYNWTTTVGSISAGQTTRSATFDLSSEVHNATGTICSQPIGPTCTAPPTCFDVIVLATESNCTDGIDNDGDGDVDCDDDSDCPKPDLFSILATNTTCGNDDGTVRIDGNILNLEYEFSSFMNGATTLLESGTVTSEPFTFSTSVGTGIYQISVRTSSASCPRVQHAFVNASEDCIGSTCSILGRNLVVNGEFDDGNVGFASDYTFAPYSTWGSGGQYGYYSVVPDNTMANVWGLWAGVERNDPLNGSFLAADPSGATGSNDDIWRQTVDVCPNQDYVFSAWAKNIFTLDYSEVSPDPNFSFYVNGVLLPGASFAIPQQTTADAGVWIQVNGLWNSGAATTAELRITNNVSGTEGNDMAIDGIYLGLCGNTVVINPNKTSACFSELVTISADANTIAGAWNFYEWVKDGVPVASGGAMTSYNTNETGVYELYAYTTFDDSGCPSISEPITIATSSTADVEVISCLEICNNGLDDDGDGLIDCQDCVDCAASVSCGDTDGDGIGDYCDLDDDNDGIPDLDECPSFTYGPELIVNGDFEDGYAHWTSDFNRGMNNFAPTAGGCAHMGWVALSACATPFGGCPTYHDYVGSVPSGGTLITDPINTGANIVYTGACNATRWDCFQYSLSDHTNGTGLSLYVDPNDIVGEAYWKQTINITANTNYEFSAWFMVIEEDPFLNFRINGTPIGPNFNLDRLTGGSGGTDTWQQYFIEWNSGSTSGPVVIELVNIRAGCAGNDIRIDDISMRARSASCDFDNDGISNHLDLDSDNDGIFDVDEAGHAAADANDDGVIDGAPADFGSNGLFDGVETAADSDVIDYSISDSENTPDGIYDAYELDSDGDGCYDTQEASVSDSDVDGIAGTGGVTVNENGLVTSTSYSSPSTTTWQDYIYVALACDTDNDLINPTVDIDDDNDGIPDVDEMYLCSHPGSILSYTGYNVSVYDADDLGYTFDSWAEISASSTFPTSSYSKIGSFTYDEFARSMNAFDISFITEPEDLNNSNPDVSDYSGTIMTSSEEDFAILFQKVITEEEIGTYQIDLTKADDHSFVYVNGNKVVEVEQAYTVTPVPNWVTIELLEGDVLDILLVEENRAYTQVDISIIKTLGDYISVSTNPALCINDIDGDGILNSLDLDSDNDGIFDVDEAGHAAADANDDGIIDGLPATFGVNGLFDGVETAADSDVIDYTIADSESTPDGLYDAYELDSDGDTCFDTEEEGISDSDDDGLAGTGVPTVDITTGLVSSISYSTPGSTDWRNPSVFACLIEICNDGIDNDGDGEIDCADDDCPGVGVVNGVSH